MSKARSLAIVFLVDFLCLFSLETVQCYFLNLLLVLQPYLVTAFLWAFHCDHFRCFKVVLPVVWLIFHIMSCSVLPFADILSGCYSMPCPKLNFLSRLCQFWKHLQKVMTGKAKRTFWQGFMYICNNIYIYMSTCIYPPSYGGCLLKQVVASLLWIGNYFDIHYSQNTCINVGFRR